jgi:hypothetical protein
MLSELHNPFSRSKASLICHSHEFFFHFTPNIAPYSVFPFRDDDCTDVMTGAVLIVTYFSDARLRRCLRRRALLVRFPSDREVRIFAELSPGEKRCRGFEMGVAVAKGRGEPVWIVSLAQLARLYYEFLDEECFADAVTESLETWHGDQAVWFSAFEDEAALWD